LSHWRVTMSIRTTVAKRLRQGTLRAQLTALYAGLLVAVVAVVLLAAAFLFRTATAPPGVETSTATSHWFEIGAGIVIVFAVLVGWWFAWRLAGLYLRPLRTLNATAREISATDLHRRLGIQGPDDEITQLGSTLDDLFARLESSFESQRRFVANASHELRTPLAGQRTLLQVALADPDATTDSLRAACEEALALGERQGQLVDGLLTLASSERGIERRESLDLAEIVDRVLVSRHQEAERRGIQMRASVEAAPISGDPILIESLIANLLDNAIQNNVPNGTIDLSTHHLRAVSKLSIGNSGPIIPAAEVERLFQPFQRLGHDRTGSGDRHGLGLAIVKAIAQAHHANITPEPRTQGGLDIAVSFPTYGSEAATNPRPNGSGTDPGSDSSRSVPNPERPQPSALSVGPARSAGIAGLPSHPEGQRFESA
ncbi:MAG: sensor histidine kinase, partial [Mycobacteriales bacterium]